MGMARNASHGDDGTQRRRDRAWRPWAGTARMGRAVGRKRPKMRPYLRPRKGGGAAVPGDRDFDRHYGDAGPLPDEPLTLSEIRDEVPRLT